MQVGILVGARPTNNGSDDQRTPECAELIIPQRGTLTFVTFAKEGGAVAELQKPARTIRGRTCNRAPINPICHRISCFFERSPKIALHEDHNKDRPRRRNPDTMRRSSCSSSPDIRELQNTLNNEHRFAARSSASAVLPATTLGGFAHAVARRFPCKMNQH